MKQKIFLIIGILIILDFTYFSYANMGLIVDYNYRPLIESFKFDNGIVMFSMALYGALCSYLLIYSKIFEKDKQLKEYSKKIEEQSLSTESTTAKVENLEEKIKTLELSLKKALGEK